MDHCIYYLLVYIIIPREISMLSPKTAKYMYTQCTIIRCIWPNASHFISFYVIVLQLREGADLMDSNVWCYLQRPPPTRSYIPGS